MLEMISNYGMGILKRPNACIMKIGYAITNNIYMQQPFTKSRS